jgi:hypothetical protein
MAVASGGGTITANTTPMTDTLVYVSVFSPGAVHALDRKTVSFRESVSSAI